MVIGLHKTKVKAANIYMKIILVGRDGTQKPTGQWSYPFPAHDGGGRGSLALLLFSFTAFLECNDGEDEKKTMSRRRQNYLVEFQYVLVEEEEEIILLPTSIVNCKDNPINLCKQCFLLQTAIQAWLQHTKDSTLQI